MGVESNEVQIEQQQEAVQQQQQKMISPQVPPGCNVSVEFEVFGHVQGVYFTKYCRDNCQQMGIYGWVKNSKRGTIVGKLQGMKSSVDSMIDWLSTTGSPGSKIDHCDLSNWEFLNKPEFRGFTIRF
ncbi:acylphosphatase-2 [Ischnura elegans]|uniref:acylphosphatase-2 n=1 Tax=Ischnura elegans TaxID=197161 RepID=UPI001ED8A108|nr:acylphosphatase-2 [Ischnura elegans]